jgi:hypothetical protein
MGVRRGEHLLAQVDEFVDPGALEELPEDE